MQRRQRSPATGQRRRRSTATGRRGDPAQDREPRRARSPSGGAGLLPETFAPRSPPAGASTPCTRTTLRTACNSLRARTSPYSQGRASCLRTSVRRPTPELAAPRSTSLVPSRCPSRHTPFRIENKSNFPYSVVFGSDAVCRRVVPVLLCERHEFVRRLSVLFFHAHLEGARNLEDLVFEEVIISNVFLHRRNNGLASRSCIDVAAACVIENCHGFTSFFTSL